MKNKILLRLILYFMASFVVFGLVIGLLFSALFSRHNLAFHHNQLEARAVNIASTLSQYMSSEARRGMGMGHGGMMGLRGFLLFIEDIAMSDVWIVDSSSRQILFGRQHMGMTDRGLPEGGEAVIARALEGHTAHCDSFSLLWGSPTITVAAPVLLPDGQVAGAVLLHLRVSEVNDLTGSGLALFLYSMGAAALVSIPLAILLSTRFTRPLGRMKGAALRICGGDFDAKTGVSQNDEIGELAAILDDMSDRLAQTNREREKLDKLRKDFVANVSHELRTPVTVIRGSLEALLDGVVSREEQVREYHAQMHLECRYLERLVTDLLDLSRLQNDGFAIESEAVDLKEIAEDAVRTMARLAEQKSISLVLNCQGDRFPAKGDYGRLRQMLITVLDNAVKFSPDGADINIDLSIQNGNTILRVRDRGCGIPPHDLDHIFERFYKQRSEQNKTGTGLGLVIARQIADRHAVSIRAENHPAGGAVFTFVIPVTGL